MKVQLYYLEKINPQIKPYWEKYFKDFDDVEIINGDICQAEVDAIVSPANSYGFMCGGLDRYLTQRFGEQISTKIKTTLKEDYKRELLIGEALAIETNDSKCPYIISAPTMIVPMDISNTINVFLSTRACLQEAKEMKLSSIAISAMGLGVGKVPPEICAKQMFEAYREVFITGWSEPMTIYDSVVNYHYLTNNN